MLNLSKVARQLKEKKKATPCEVRPTMRPVALGRKNWIHIGSPQAGPKVAAILSVVENCRRLKLPVRDYLAAVLPGFADLPIQYLPDRTPAVWVAQHS